MAPYHFLTSMPLRTTDTWTGEDQRGTVQGSLLGSLHNTPAAIRTGSPRVRYNRIGYMPHQAHPHLNLFDHFVLIALCNGSQIFLADDVAEDCGRPRI